MSVIRARGLQYRYDDGAEALRGVDFDLAAGECVALLGPNGSGKTTFALHLNGILQRFAGELAVCGLEPVKANLQQLRRKVGVVFQDSDEQLFMPTVLEDVLFGPLNQGLSPADAEAKARQALAQVHMDWAVAKAPYHLSSGEKRRVALAGVLAMEPALLVLDEPTTYLDPPGQRDLARFLLALPQAKLIVTHDIPFARALASRAVFFDKGLVAGQGTVNDVIRRFDWEFR